MTEFLIGYILGFVSAVKLLLIIIYWPEIKSWAIDKKEWAHVKWILWKHR